MGSFSQNHQEESAYLEKVTAFIKNELDNENTMLVEKKRRLIEIRKDMYENTVHFSSDFDRLTEANQYLSEVNYQAAYYSRSLKQIEMQKNMLDSPYFGRFDFIEEGLNIREKIYVGLSNVMDSQTNSILVYDWRAPISGMFYQYEPGSAMYNAPAGTISGDMLLKRQYKIKNSRLRYFYDCSIKINDEILQKVLSQNSSPGMRNIVETIQKEQDTAIRDTENELLIVQGVVGSGKTSIALHRIAFLLYSGISSGLNRGSFIIISPNAIFSKYISSVLPELGEENVEQITFDDIAARHFAGRIDFETRNSQLELLTIQGQGETALRRSGIEFKGSLNFVQLLDRLIQHYERSMIPFEDVYYDGTMIETRQRIKNIFLDNKYGVPMAKRLKRIENIILNKVHPLQRKRLARIEQTVADSEGHELEVKSFSRLLSIKKTRVFMDRLHRFTEVDYVHLYKALFDDPGLLKRLAGGLELPEDIEQIITQTRGCLEKGYVHYEDCGPLLYLKLRVEGSSMFSDIRQVVIDEAQDYYPMQYEVLKILFREARYTVLGDIHQSIERDVDISLYDDIVKILGREKAALRLVLNKSYRSSFEINRYTRRLLAGKQKFISFNRHTSRPVVVYREARHLVDQAMVRDIDSYFEQGYGSIAIITKTRAGAEDLYARLKDLTLVNLVGNNERKLKKGALIIPAYTAKGLEFDVVLVDDASKENYSTGYDRKLLYIACTRALHQLALYYTGGKSPFV